MAYTNVSKSYTAIAILRILEEYTDEKHSMTQKQIQEKLEEDYEIVVDRKTVLNNINLLLEATEDFGIFGKVCYYYTDRGDSTIKTNFYIKRFFDTRELQLMIYDVMFSKTITVTKKKELIEKIEKMDPFLFKHKMSNYLFDKVDGKDADNKLFEKMELLNHAMNEHLLVSFQVYDPIREKLLPARDVAPLGISVDDDEYCLIYANKAVVNGMPVPEKVKHRPPDAHAIPIKSIKELKVTEENEEKFSTQGDRIKKLPGISFSGLDTLKYVEAAEKQRNARMEAIRRREEEDFEIEIKNFKSIIRPSRLLKPAWKNAKIKEHEDGSATIHIRTSWGHIKFLITENPSEVKLISPESRKQDLKEYIDSLQKCIE